MHHEGNLRKMESLLADPVEYGLPIGNFVVPMNPLIGQFISLQYKGLINCIHCGRKTSKSFAQGYCYPCMRSLAECDSCIVRPESCHIAEGTCRDEEWAQNHCMQDHFVYLANSSGIKVGITRGTQIPTRWIDQGAFEAMPIFRVRDRLLSGKLEVIIKQQVSDRTDWRRMLRGEPENINLADAREQIMDSVGSDIENLIAAEGEENIMPVIENNQVQITYPVREYPDKVVSLGFDKTPEIHGRLLGIKGQYLILDKGVINMRKHAGYHIKLTA